MPIEVDNDTGILIQTQDQILAETNQTFIDGSGVDGFDGFGPDFELTDDSFTYRQNAIWANREASLQSATAAAFSSLDLDHATGVQLDFAGTFLVLPRQASSRSTIPARLIGVPGTNVADKRVQYILTGDLWRTPLVDQNGDPLVLPANGRLETTLDADATGPIFAAGAGTSAWVIVDVTSGWTSVESTDDAERGRVRQEDPSYRDDLKAVQSATTGGTEPAVRKGLSTTPGVASFTYFANRSPVADNGVPAWHCRAIVSGGVDLTIATTLYNTVGDTTGFFGNTEVIVIDPTDGAQTLVKFSRILNRQITGSFVFKRSADRALPIGAANTVVEAIAARVNTNGAGIDVDPGDLLCAGAGALPPGTVLPDDAATVGTVQFKIGGAPTTSPLAIEEDENAFTITVDQPAVVTGTQTGPFNMVDGETLVLSVDAGALFSLIANNADYVNIAAATIDEIVAAFSVQAPENLQIGQSGGALTLTTDTRGGASNISVDASSTLLAALGFIVGVTSGTGSDIEVTFIDP